MAEKMDFDWNNQQEPHKTRRKLILDKHPCIKNLMVSDRKIIIKIFLLIITQTISAFLIRNHRWYLNLTLAYFWGGFWNHSLALGIHEISHNLAFGFKYLNLNKILGILGNLPMAIPYSISFQKYHLEHHKYQGDSRFDVDLPSNFEAKFFQGKFKKLIWLFFQPCFYALRPLCLNPKPLVAWDYINITTQLIYNLFIYHFFGGWALFYLISSTFLSMGIHPMAGHFVSEHYVFLPGQETYSYYGPLNSLAFNVGYHNEHHDFPNIPGSNLPKVKLMAPEFYNNLKSYNSWTKVLWEFITDDRINLFCRIKRKTKSID